MSSSRNFFQDYDQEDDAPRPLRPLSGSHANQARKDDQKQELANSRLKAYRQKTIHNFMQQDLKQLRHAEYDTGFDEKMDLTKQEPKTRNNKRNNAGKFKQPKDELIQAEKIVVMKQDQRIGNYILQVGQKSNIAAQNNYNGVPTGLYMSQKDSAPKSKIVCIHFHTFE